MQNAWVHLKMDFEYDGALLTVSLDSPPKKSSNIQFFFFFFLSTKNKIFSQGYHFVLLVLAPGATNASYEHKVNTPLKLGVAVGYAAGSLQLLHCMVGLVGRAAVYPQCKASLQ